VETNQKGQIGLRNGMAADGVLKEIARLTRLAVEAVAPEFDKRTAQRLKHLPRLGQLKAVLPRVPLGSKVTTNT
jgi:ubiquinone/menaquinone biosynthesis C-methylase UbiE